MQWILHMSRYATLRAVKHVALALLAAVQGRAAQNVAPGAKVLVGVATPIASYQLHQVGCPRAPLPFVESRVLEHISIEVI